MKRPKKGERYINYKGEYCVIKSIYRNIIKLQICGDKARTEPWKIEDFLKASDHFYLLPYPKINRTNIGRHLLEYQLNMIGKSTTNTIYEENWFNLWTMTTQDYNFLKSYAIPLLKKTFKCNTNKAKETFDWFIMQFGLTIKDK